MRESHSNELGTSGERGGRSEKRTTDSAGELYLRPSKIVLSLFGDSLPKVLNFKKQAELRVTDSRELWKLAT